MVKPVVNGIRGHGLGRSLTQSLLRWPLEQLPLSCDALVLTPMELEELLTSGSRMAHELQRDLRWLPWMG